MVDAETAANRQGMATRVDSLEQVLATVFNTHQLRLDAIGRMRHFAEWECREGATGHGQFHLIEEGHCQVSGPGLAFPVQLGPGDVIIFPRGSSHALRPCPPESGIRNVAGVCTTILRGELDIASGIENPIFAALPDYFLIRRAAGGQVLHALACVLLHASSTSSLGQQIVRNKLADSFFSMAVLEYVRSADDFRGVFAALLDRRLARVLAAIHCSPNTCWTLDSLAALASMSRTSLALRFRDLIGIPPIQYLRQWRICEAQRLLRNKTISVATVAEMVGYSSEASFRHSFKRVAGVAPGSARAFSPAPTTRSAIT